MLKISQSYPFISHVNHWWHHDSTEIGPDRWEIPDPTINSSKSWEHGVKNGKISAVNGDIIYICIPGASKHAEILGFAN
jgi:hypothetical protein